MDNGFAQDSYTIEQKGVDWQPFEEYGFSSPWAPRLRRASIATNYLLSTLITVIVAIIFASLSEQCQHWCLIPLILCGVLACADIVAWFRKEIDIFDPKSFIAAFLYLNCFLAPLLHLRYNIYGQTLYIDDWPAWFGYMACFNAAGIILLKLGQRIAFKRSRPAKSFRSIESGRFLGIAVVLLAISLAANAVIRIFFGGLVREVGQMQWTAAAEAYAYHLSWIMMLADPAGLLMVMIIVYWIYSRNPDKTRSMVVVGLILFLAALWQLYFFGFRGSRSAILVPIVMFTAIIHYRLRPVSIKFMILGICVAFIFVHLYDFYKKLGIRGFEAFYSKEARESMAYERRTTLLTTLTGDLARADLQAYMLYRLKTHGGEYQYTWGGTYAMAVLTFIPRAIWRNKPNPKPFAGALLLTGQKVHSTRVFGLAGEGMLNFGYYGIVPPFFVVGLMLGWFRKKIATMEPYDARFFLIPVLLMLFQGTIVGDMGLWVYGTLRLGMLPFVLVYFSSTRTAFADKD